jgi:integrase
MTNAVPWEIRREAAICAAKLSPYRAKLTEAVDYYVQQVLQYRTSPSVSDVIKRMLDELKAGGRRETAIRTLRCFLGGAFTLQFGERQLSTVALDELNVICLVPDLQPRTRLNRIRMVSQLYNYAVKHGWVSGNLAERIVRPILEKKEPGYLDVDAARRFLEHADEFGLLPYAAIGLFAGVRSAELLRLDWSAVNLIDREITIGSEIAKTRSRRVIPYGDDLAAWLKRCARCSGPVVNPNNFEGNFGRLKRAAGIKNWPQNALRHSFASYHVAQYRDPVRTAYLLGHRGGTDMLDSHYRGLVSSAKAKEFWALRPSGQMVQAALRDAA